MAPLDNGQQDLLIGLTRKDVDTIFKKLNSIEITVVKLQTQAEDRWRLQSIIVPGVVSGVMAVIVSVVMFCFYRAVN